MIAPRFEMETVRDGYIELVQAVRDKGHHVSPRGLGCREVTGATIVVHEPLVDAMPVGLGRRLNPAIGVCEALQLVGGVSTPELLCKIAPNFSSFLDGGAFYGAYGPRIAAALDEVHRKLEDDPDSRQAVATIWRPDDAWAVTRDLPCTLSLQFLIRDNALELHTAMRSNDLWWGWSYDAFQFTRLQQAMADALDVGVGPYVHRVGSLHLYDRDLEAVDELERRPNHAPKTYALVRDSKETFGFGVYRQAARILLGGGWTDLDVNGDYAAALDRHLRPAVTR